jgi:hypothetical protein
MEESKKRVILHMMRVLNKLAGSSAEESVKKAALQMIEDLWYQYLVIESFTKDEGEQNAKRKRSKKKGKGQRALQSVPTLQPPHIDVGGAR